MLIDDLKNSTTTKASLLTELRRKAVHFFALSIPIGLVIVPRGIALLILAICAFISVLLDLLKYYDKKFRRLFYKFFGNMLRTKEIKRFTGSSYILFAAIICSFAFDRWVSATVITFIILGDIAAAIFGKRFGNHKTIGNKTLEGSLAFFLSAYFGGILLKLIACLPTPWTALFMGALTATVIESLPLGIDDNLSVPVLTGVLIQLMYIGHF